MIDRNKIEEWEKQARKTLRELGHTDKQIDTYSICEDGSVYYNRGSIYDFEKAVVSPLAE